ncbi:MAG TPA: hypothetical protein ENK11_00865 [Phycisphaerales bacterium]|nr:hypothetical protein [Phycisphaerales bacterium]
MPGLRFDSARTRWSAAMVCTACLLAGCGGRGEDAEALEESSRHLAAVGAGTYTDAQYTYASVSQELSRLEKGSGTISGVASGLLAQSAQGEGSLVLGEAMLADRSLFDEINDARALALRYAALTTTSTSLSSFDPSDDIAQVTQEAEALAQQAEKRRGDRARLAEEIGRLEDRAGSLASEATAKREKAAQMKLSAASLSAIEAARMSREIRSITREADALDLEVNRLRGQIEMLHPRLDEINGDIEKLDEQHQLALAFADELRQKQQNRRERAVRLRAEAAGIAEQVRALVGSIATQRENEIIPASDKAIASFERAVRAGGKAGRVDRVSAQLSKAAAQRRLAEALHLRSQGFARFASLLDELASNTPPLPESDEYAAMAGKQHAEADETLEKAADMYEQAASTLRSSGVRGAEREQIESVADAFEALAGRLRGESEQPTEAPESSEETPGGEADGGP